MLKIGGIYPNVIQGRQYVDIIIDHSDLSNEHFNVYTLQMASEIISRKDVLNILADQIRFQELIPENFSIVSKWTFDHVMDGYVGQVPETDLDELRKMIEMRSK